ncbi:hypothetical protein [Nocardioides luteus]|uniref:hypothetical protein n=1 Tax=Nocardioides luteus TaxID=1844 RepID=UPI0018C94BEF|nr:hypothetical protein [Nocardioides luteus]MBG6098876.1 hypothetical protein [Nocardioides luteus]
MRLPDDDELYEVDQTYLGPPRRYIGEMRYRTIFLFLVIAPVTLVLLRKLGMPVTLLSMGLWLIGASYLSMKASDYISSESSAGAWLMTFWHELTTPRVETGVQYAGGAAVAFRHATSPRGGWAKAMRRPGRRFAQQPGATPEPQMLQATVVASKPRTHTPPVRGKAAPVRPVIEAKVVEEPLPAQLKVQPAVQPVRQPARQHQSGVRPAKGGWSSRPSSSPREPRDVPWKGGAPWQARQEREQPAPPPPPAASPAPPPPPAPPATPAPPASPSATPPTTPVAPPARPAAPPPSSPPPPPPAQAPAAQQPAPKPADEATGQEAPKPARQPLSHAVRPAVVIAPEPGLDDLDEFDDFDEFDDAPSGRTRPRDNQDEWATTDERPQSVDDYRKRLNGDDAPNDGGTA